jgi:glutamate dehydrogenase
MIVVDLFGVRDAWQSIEYLDNKVPGQAQMMALSESSQVVKREVTWFLRFGGGSLQVEEQIAAFKPGVELLKKNVEKVIPDSVRQTLLKNEAKLAERGMPKEISRDIAVMTLLSAANDIITISHRTKGDIQAIAAAYFQTGEKFGLDWLRHQAVDLEPENAWQARAISGLIDDFYIQQAALTAVILLTTQKQAHKSKTGQEKLINEWFVEHHEMVEKIYLLINDLKQEQAVKLEMLTLVSQRIGQLVYQVK